MADASYHPPPSDDPTGARTPTDHPDAAVIGPHTPETAIGPAIAAGFGSAAIVAVTALVVAAPALRLGAAVAGPILLVVWLAAAAFAARRLPKPRRLVWGAVAGLVTAGLLLVFLGSLLAEPAVSELPAANSPTIAVGRIRPSAPLIVLGFLGLGSVIGVLGAAASRLLPHVRGTGWPWPARLALAAAGATLPLLLLGGLVTSTESGMAVPDWPGSYGANMVLFPLGLMANPRIFLEHSHRLFGMLVGLSTIATALAVQFSAAGRRAPRAARLAAWIAVPLVITQGVLGGTRVTEHSVVLATLHGIVGQLFLTLMACLVAMLTPAWADRPTLAPKVIRLSNVLFGMLVAQLVFGALFRHSGGRSWHPLAAHGALALGILVMAPLLGARLGKAVMTPTPDGSGAARAIRLIGKGLMHATALQFLLGWGALVGALMGAGRGAVPLHTQLQSAEPVPLWEVVLTTAHQANGALLLVVAGLAVVWAWRRRPLPG